LKLKEDVGNQLNKALSALEEANLELDGVLKHIDFNKEFADSAGKKGGEFYTPPHVKKLMVRLVKPREGMSIHDPTVGSGGFLIEAFHYVEEQGQNRINLALYGQELNGLLMYFFCRID
jgi:type I restriction enzyme M protein